MLPDPAILKLDGFSSGANSMEPHVLKVFLSSAFWNCSHEFFRIIPYYGSYQYNGEDLDRKKTGAGLYNTLIYAFERPVFPNSDISALGLDVFKKNIIKYVLDKGLGNLSVSKEVEKTKSLQSFVEESVKRANLEWN